MIIRLNVQVKFTKRFGKAKSQTDQNQNLIQ